MLKIMLKLREKGGVIEPSINECSSPFSPKTKIAVAGNVIKIPKTNLKSR
jgi:hypothetical protein